MELAMAKKPIYKRVLLKMSGEVLMGRDNRGTIDPVVLDRLVDEVISIYKLGVQVAIVIGGGNFFRGKSLSEAGISRITADYMGMLGTMMNALALRDSFERSDIPVRILSSIPMSGIADHFNLRKAIHHLESSRIIIFAGGTGNPLVTTDTAASLRGIEIQADVLLKATNVDGIYDKDPNKYSDAKRYRYLNYGDVLSKELGVMDLGAFCQCRDHNLPIRVFNVQKHNMLQDVVTGIDEGTLVALNEEVI
jgi:uridylate kinase